METRNQNSRLDVHEQQIKQLQSDVAEIKQLLTEDRSESTEFRKMMAAWMTQFEKRPEDSSSSDAPQGLHFQLEHGNNNQSDDVIQHGVDYPIKT
ncbi:hypothetical protein E3N88_29774 [Mikania micrantha]|uniref:Uncharacterized protein n=1 Tax=Mikania micrantha TaxID=192012 RepID=A0A5N6MJR6_9ASTR|nr:hypothetical protein E3N88_29774 [Mikania micrantha]